METLIGSANRGSISTEVLYDIPYSLCFLDNVQGDDANDWLKPTNDWAYAYPGGPVSQEYTSIKTATLSFWMKRGQKTTGTSGDIEGICSGFSSARRGVIWIRSDLTGELTFNHPLANATDAVPHGTVNDHSAWYHIVLALDTTSGTAANRERVYINGREVDWSTAPDWDQNQTFSIFSHSPSWLVIGAGGHYGNQDDKAFTGYLAEWHFVDGQQLAPTVFGEFHSSSGIWIPIEYEGTYGGTGHYLKFDDASNLGHDEDVHSGAGGALHYDENGLTTQNQSTDTPTNNFCTLNPLWKYASDITTRSHGNLKISGTQLNWAGAKGTMGVDKGKWYWEAKGSAGDVMIGIQTDGPGDIYGDSNNAHQILDTCIITLASNSPIYIKDSTSSRDDTTTTSTFNSSHVYAVALNMDDNEISFYQDGSLITNAGDVSIDGLSDKVVFPFCTNYNTTAEMNFGGTNVFSISSGNADGNGYGNFEHAPPSGYYALCTKNLAEFG